LGSARMVTTVRIVCNLSIGTFEPPQGIWLGRAADAVPCGGIFSTKWGESMGMNVDMIPTRTRLGKRQAQAVGEVMAGRLLAQWGLENAGKIAQEIRVALAAERKRRKGQV
jgi:hypothetical protein